MATSTDLEQAQARVRAAYDVDLFARTASSWLRRMVTHFRDVSTRQPAVLNWRDPPANVAEAARSLIQGPSDVADATQLDERFSELIATTLQRGHNLHHPRYLGHQVPASVPLAALFDAVGSATNQVMAVYEMGPWATSVERAVIDKLGSLIGYAPGTFAGICTHGGSLANLTALLTARNKALDGAWKTGLASQGMPPLLLVQDDVHYSVIRAAGVLGIGTDHLVRIPVDDQRKMSVPALSEQLTRSARNGRSIIAVVAGACATPTGAFDPLDRIADVCQQHKVWLHVDAAHGGAALMSPRHRHLLTGLDRADSVVWDAHKMLFMPALCAFVFYRDKADRFVAFQQDAPYLFDPTNPGIAEYDSGTQTVECTKRAAALGLWGTWSVFGQQLFADLVDVTFDLAQRFHQKLSEAGDFVPLHLPECNIQVFRYQPPETAAWSPSELGNFQLELRRAVITSGDAYIVPIKIRGVGALRSTLINPLTGDDDLDAVLDMLRRHGQQLIHRDAAAAEQETQPS